MEKEKIIELIQSYKLPLGLSLVGIVLIIGGIFVSSPTKQSYPKESIIGNKTQSYDIKVDISGAVISPGVYSLTSGLRVIDALKLAGGFSTLANSDYIAKSLNLSQKLTDGQKIYIPFQGEKFVSGQVAGVDTKLLISINAASSTELESLPGIGPVTAQNIISARPYNDISELLNKKIVSKSTFEKIKNLIVI